MSAAAMAGRSVCALCQCSRDGSERLALHSFADDDSRRVLSFPSGLAHDRINHGDCTLLSGGWFNDAHAHSLWTSDACSTDHFRRSGFLATQRICRQPKAFALTDEEARRELTTIS